MASNRIETLIAEGEWGSAQSAIEKQLHKEPDDHWLWSRLSAVKYEQRDYQGALEAADKGVQIVPDCPLALWSYANALDMLGNVREAGRVSRSWSRSRSHPQNVLGNTREAGRVYIQLLRRGLQELSQPDEDADECWEGADWTRGLVVDCMFRIAGCLAKMRKRQKAIEWYKRFLDQVVIGVQPGIYSREDAQVKLRELLGINKVNDLATESAMEIALREAEGVLG
jgi:tetratricopeptide (TPR) repeat protein